MELSTEPILWVVPQGESNLYMITGQVPSRCHSSWINTSNSRTVYSAYRYPNAISILRLVRRKDGCVALSYKVVELFQARSPS